MKVDAITVCVDYSEYLALIVGNKAVFDRWMIVTVKQDKDTIALCEREGLDYCFSERLYEGGPFCKGKAINDGLMELRPQDWVCQLDADTYLFPALRTAIEEANLDSDCMYGLYGRLLVNDGAELKAMLDKEQISPDELEHVGLAVGYFQMWHSSMRQFYPEQSTHAGLDDILMRESYSLDKVKLFPSYAIHIGQMWVNHKGIPDDSSS